MRRRLLVLASTVVLLATALVTTGSPAQATHRGGLEIGGKTQVVVAPAVYDLIVGAGITPAPLDGARAYPLRGTLAAAFPITGLQLRNARLTHSGGLSLSAGDRTIELRNFNIDLGRARVSAEVEGTIGNVGRVDLFKIRPSRSRLGLVRLTLTDTAAGALNATFDVDAFSQGDTFGFATPKPRFRFARHHLRSALR